MSVVNAPSWLKMPNNCSFLTQNGPFFGGIFLLAFLDVLDQFELFLGKKSSSDDTYPILALLL